MTLMVGCPLSVYRLDGSILAIVSPFLESMSKPCLLPKRLPNQSPLNGAARVEMPRPSAGVLVPNVGAAKAEVRVCVWRVIP